MTAFPFEEKRILQADLLMDRDGSENNIGLYNRRYDVIF